MRQDQQRKLDSLNRAQDFFGVHADVLGAIGSSAARAQIDQSVAGIRDYVTAQGTADRILVGQNSQQRKLAKDLVKSHMAPIAKFARANLRGVPDFSTLSKSGNPLSPKELVTGALTMANAAAPYVSAMTAGGFPADTVAQLTAAANALNAATIARDNTRHRRVGSTKNIETLIKSGREGVRKIDAVISKQFVSDEAFLASWKSASRVDAKPGSVRKPVPVTTPAAMKTPAAVATPSVAVTPAAVTTPSVVSTAVPVVSTGVPSVSTAVPAVSTAVPVAAGPATSVVTK